MVQQDGWQGAVAREARAAPEFAAFMATAGPLLLRLPRGDRHQVLVLPGLGGGDASTRPLRWFLGRLGYRVHGWGLGRNTGPSDHFSSALDARLRALFDTDGQPVSLIGWSLGGLFANALAQRSPHRVRMLITLGSPLSRQRLAPVPFTSVYSRSDSIVPWQASVLPAGPQRQNVEVRGSHLGLGHNPGVVVVAADRLSQPVGTWRPFVSPTWARRWLPDRASNVSR